jgi:hypothetical protein
VPLLSWWKSRTERTVDQFVPASVEEVRAFYVDLDKIKLVHPLVVSVRTVARTATFRRIRFVIEFPWARSH